MAVEAVGSGAPSADGPATVLGGHRGIVLRDGCAAYRALARRMVEDAIASLARLVERANIPYALIGGHAVNGWSEPRFTADVDVTGQATPADL